MLFVVVISTPGEGPPALPAARLKGPKPARSPPPRRFMGETLNLAYYT